MENTSNIATIVATGSAFSNTCEANLPLNDPKIEEVIWTNLVGEKVKKVNYGKPVCLSIKTKEANGCYLFVIVHCDDWKQDYAELIPVAFAAPHHASSTNSEETVFSFVPNAEWSDVASSEMVAMVYVVFNMHIFRILSQEQLSQMAVVFKNGESYRSFLSPYNREYVIRAEIESDSIEVLLKGVCPIDASHRSHFVIHCTDGNMLESSIKSLTNSNTPQKLRSKAHKYIMNDGKVIEVWPFTERNVWATKAESQNHLKGQMFHVELNYGSPSVPSDAQYNSLADLYIEASEIEYCWPIIVPHIEIDRGILDGHGDPTDFDYNKFYEILRNRGVPIDEIPHFDHDRYWGHPTYRIPWGDDTNSWPPVLNGNPHKK
jgi:hypothetical protein